MIRITRRVFSHSVGGPAMLAAVCALLFGGISTAVLEVPRFVDGTVMSASTHTAVDTGTTSATSGSEEASSIGDFLIDNIGVVVAFVVVCAVLVWVLIAGVKPVIAQWRENGE